MAEVTSSSLVVALSECCVLQDKRRRRVISRSIKASPPAHATILSDDTWDPRFARLVPRIGPTSWDPKLGSRREPRCRSAVRAHPYPLEAPLPTSRSALQ